MDWGVSEALPYPNTVHGGFEYLKDPPAVTFRAHGKIITVHPREIAANALKDEEVADRIPEWLKREINEAWEKRNEIEPRYEGAPKLKLLEILRLLPLANCRNCGEPTSMVFAAKIAEGAKGPEDCPPLKEEKGVKLQEYMEPFQFDVEHENLLIEEECHGKRN